MGEFSLLGFAAEVRGSKAKARVPGIQICSAAISMRPATVRMGIRHRGNGMIVAGLLSGKGGETVLSVAATLWLRLVPLLVDRVIGQRRRVTSRVFAWSGQRTAVPFAQTLRSSVKC